MQALLSFSWYNLLYLISIQNKKPFPDGKSLHLRPCCTHGRLSAQSQKHYIRRQVSRLCINLRDPFPPSGSGFDLFVRITVTGLARNLHPIPTAVARRCNCTKAYGIELSSFYLSSGPLSSPCSCYLRRCARDIIYCYIIMYRSAGGFICMFCVYIQADSSQKPSVSSAFSRYFPISPNYCATCPPSRAESLIVLYVFLFNFA